MSHVRRFTNNKYLENESRDNAHVDVQERGVLFLPTCSINVPPTIPVKRGFLVTPVNTLSSSGFRELNSLHICIQTVMFPRLDFSLLFENHFLL